MLAARKEASGPHVHPVPVNTASSAPERSRCTSGDFALPVPTFCTVTSKNRGVADLDVALRAGDTDRPSAPTAACAAGTVGTAMNAPAIKLATRQPISRRDQVRPLRAVSHASM